MRNLDIIRDARQTADLTPSPGVIGAGATGVPLLEEKKPDRQDLADFVMW